MFAIVVSSIGEGIC